MILFYFIPETIEALSLKTLCCVFFRFQWFQIHWAARETTGNWTPVRSQQRWCVVTSKESCSSSLSWPLKWKWRPRADHQSTAQLSILLNLQPVELFRSDVRWSSAVLSPLNPSWRETVPLLGPPELFLCPMCRSEQSSSLGLHMDELGQRGAWPGTLRSLSSFKLQLEVHQCVQQGAAHTRDSLLMELLSPSRRGCMCTLRPHSPSTQEPVLLLISAVHTAVTSHTLYPHLPTMLSVFVCKFIFSYFHIALLYVLFLSEVYTFFLSDTLSKELQGP